MQFRIMRRSFRYAWRGLVHTWRAEQNFRLQVLAAAVVLAAALWLGLSPLRLIVVIVLITMVLVLELLNTFFERLVDLLSPRVHAYAAMLKDLLAATVLIASLGAAAAGVLLFWPYLLGI